jgi:hypothetical protein
MAIVYRHHRLDKNEVFYVGIGNKESRALDMVHRNHIWKGIKSRSEVDVEIVARDLSWELACELEQLMISEYGRIDLHSGTLANLTDGGDGSVGVKQSQETIDKRANSNRGRKNTEETKRKMSEARKGIVFTAEHLENLRTSHLGQKGWNAKEVIDLQTGFAYDSLREGCLSVGVSYKAEWAKQNRKSKKVRFEII